MCRYNHVRNAVKINIFSSSNTATQAVRSSSGYRNIVVTCVEAVDWYNSAV